MDLRGFIERLDKQGRLKRLTHPVDWKCELGAITRETKAPLLFENIRGYPGRRVFTNGLIDFEAIAVALDLGLGKKRTMLREARRRAASPIKPIVVESGAVTENVVPAEDIDFFKLPIPQWHPEDAGRYIGTWQINVTKDLKTGTRNLGVYRMQVLGPNRATVSTSPGSHLGRHLAEAERTGQPLEMAVAIGVSEAVMMAASASYAFGSDEYDLAGGLEGTPVELLRCQTVNVEVPADSEIVIEGVIQPGVRAQDGPYFDYAGKPSTNRKAFVFEASRMMFRNAPIFRGTSIGLPGAEDHQLFAVLADLDLVDFHGSKLKQWVQNQFLRRRMFKPFQLAGRMGTLVSGKG